MPTKIRIDVNGTIAKKNRQEGCNDPAIRITQGDTSWTCKNIVILGPSTLVQIPVEECKDSKPYIFIETESPFDWQ